MSKIKSHLMDDPAWEEARELTMNAEEEAYGRADEDWQRAGGKRTRNPYKPGSWRWISYSTRQIRRKVYGDF